jgi:hypothetical protein
MRILDTIRRNPVALLAAAVAGIGGLVVAELLAPPPPLTERPLLGSGPQAAVTESPLPPLGVSPPPFAILPKLRPGMPRVEVEELLGHPTADAVQPVTLTDGQLRYRAAYDLGDPDPPATVRPIKRLPTKILPPAPGESSGIRVALEYDASKPGHPLVDILYPDPLF